MIAIILPTSPDLSIALGLPPDVLSPNADRGMPQSLKAARGLAGARNQAGRAYEAEAKAATLRAAREAGCAIEPAAVTLLLRFFWKSAGSCARRDLDNAAGSFKKGQDGIALGLGINDRRVAQLPPVFRVDKRRPRVEVEIYFSAVEWGRDV